jgi:hypothetical protein
MYSPMQVQHLIEKCICYDMDKEECVKALEKHANIMPAVTSTGNTYNIAASVHSFALLPIGGFSGARGAHCISKSASACMLNFIAHSVHLALVICVHAKE